jgi:hypothetical protein
VPMAPGVSRVTEPLRRPGREHVRTSVPNAPQRLREVSIETTSVDSPRHDRQVQIQANFSIGRNLRAFTYATAKTALRV